MSTTTPEGVVLERDFWIYLIITLLSVVIGVYFLTQEVAQDQIALSLFWISATFLSLALLTHGIMGLSPSTTYIIAVFLYLLTLIVSLIWISAPTAIGPIVSIILLNLLLYLILGQRNHTRSCLVLAIVIIWLGLAVYILLQERQLS